jgi:hypothetical protein
VKGLALILGKPKGKGVMSDEDEAPESETAEKKDSYDSVMAEAAEAGDWKAFASAVKGYVRSCMGDEE